MTQLLSNTRTKTKESFVAGDPSRVLFYTCGPTVYDYAHIGNFRSFLFADVLRRWLESPLCTITGVDGASHTGPREVVHVMNITDVGHMTEDDLADGGGEDKMEAASRRLLEAKKGGTLPEDADIDPGDPMAIATFYRDEFVEDGLALGIRVVRESLDDPSLLPRATDNIAGMLEIVVTLMENGHAYAQDDAVYFDTETFEAYGQLSGNTIDAIRSGAGGRVDSSTQGQKRHPADFLLWKADSTHLMRWNPSEVLGRDVGLGEGYPGWHIECSAMSLGRLAPEDGIIDLHSGGEDNIFPHHECEIAQSCCFTGAPDFARTWVHARFLQIEGEKMSKSRGNFYSLRDLVDAGFTPAAIRLELIKSHYHRNANFTQQGLMDSQRRVEKWHRFHEAALASDRDGDRDERVLRDFSASMHDDLNTAGAIGAIDAWINRTSTPSRADAEVIEILDHALGVLDLEYHERASSGDDPDAARIEGLIRARNEARASKDWATSDRIRDELQAMGVAITDTPDGTSWERAASL
ncbi:MAG: cysteine--tRNA ligase [Planctomycetota bacterium]|jgi:cysteinyl-tRNA synthetase